MVLNKINLDESGILLTFDTGEELIFNKQDVIYRINQAADSIILSVPSGTGRSSFGGVLTTILIDGANTVPEKIMKIRQAGFIETVTTGSSAPALASEATVNDVKNLLANTTAKDSTLEAVRVLLDTKTTTEVTAIAIKNLLTNTTASEATLVLVKNLLTALNGTVAKEATQELIRQILLGEKEGSTFDAYYQGIPATIEIVREEDGTFIEYIATLKDGSGTVVNGASLGDIKNYYRNVEFESVHVILDEAKPDKTIDEAMLQNQLFNAIEVDYQHPRTDEGNGVFTNPESKEWAIKVFVVTEDDAQGEVETVYVQHGGVKPTNFGINAVIKRVRLVVVVDKTPILLGNNGLQRDIDFKEYGGGNGMLSGNLYLQVRFLKV